MALNMYARYIVVGRITNSGKNEYFVFDDRKEARRVRMNRAQTAYLIGSNLVSNMKCTVNPKGGVQFELGGVSEGQQMRDLPVLGDVTPKIIPDTEKYRIVALVKDGRNTVGYQVQYKNEKAKTMQPHQIAEIIDKGYMLNAKLIVQNGRRILTGVNCNLKDLPVYTPGEILMQDKFKGTIHNADKIKALFGKSATKRVPAIRKYTVMIDGIRQQIYGYTGSMNTDLWTYGVDSNSDDVEAVMRNIDTLSYKIYAVVNTEVTGRVRIDNIITSVDRLDKDRFGTASEILLQADVDTRNRKIYPYQSYFCNGQRGKRFIYEVMDPQKPDEVYYVYSMKFINSKNIKNIDQFMKFVNNPRDQRILGDILLTHSTEVLMSKQAVYKQMYNQSLGFDNPVNGVQVIRGAAASSQNSGAGQPRQKDIGIALDKQQNLVEKYLEKATQTLTTEQAIKKQQVQSSIEAQKIVNFNDKNGRLKYKIRFIKDTSNGYDVMTMQIIRNDVPATDPNRNIRQVIRVDETKASDEIRVNLDNQLRYVVQMILGQRI